MIDHDHPALLYERPLTEPRFVELVDFFASVVGVNSDDLIVDFVDEHSYRLFHVSELEEVNAMVVAGDGEESAEVAAEIATEIAAALQRRNPSEVLVIDLPTWIASYSYFGREFAYSPFGDETRELDELLCLFSGLGPVFAAHSLVTERPMIPMILGGWQFDSNPKKHVALSTIDIGSVLGIFQFALRNPNPAWIRKLRPDVRKTMSRMQKYLQTTNPFFGPDSLFQKKTPATLERLRELLNSPRIVDQIIALRCFLPQLEPDAVDTDTLLEMTKAKEADLRNAATAALINRSQREGKELPPPARDRMLQLIEDRDGRVQATAAYGLADLTLNEKTVDSLCYMLHDSDRDLAQAAGYALRRSSQFVDLIVPQLCRAISFCVARGENPMLNTLIDTLDEICERPEEHLLAALDNNEHDFLYAVTDILRDVRIAKRENGE